MSGFFLQVCESIPDFTHLETLEVNALPCSNRLSRISSVPAGRTRMALERITDGGERCWLCNSDMVDEVRIGPLFKFRKIVLHQFCLLFSYAVEQNGRDNEGILGFLLKDILLCLSTVRSNVCMFCSRRNASVKCAKKRCSKIFHFPCGVENGSLNQFKGRFDSFCPDHRPKQRVPREVVKRARKESPICLICHEEVEIRDPSMVLWASCCRYTWYHRNCLQKYASSAGRFLFRCVACRDKGRFKRLAETYGIYLPKRDASWESVPQAYQELYAIYSRCDARECLCPYGREFYEDDGSWNVLVCHLCGSQGIHARCSSSVVRSWTCEICLSVVPSSETTPLPIRSD